ncbi:copper transporter [Demequina sp. NBRC 110052]|uniref:copper transporter n=1 Tax=Demequina sp. NBRC 110052 TaxID=1570341 RepID=UPI000A029E69|nr:copper transporter [Demequina sp. NBRC 110052]
MTSFRYHVVSLAAVFLALAVGVVLGSGPMRTALVGDLNDEVDRLEAEVAEGEAQVEQAQLSGVVGEQFAMEAEPLLLGGTLDGATVALVSVLGATTGQADAVRDALVVAGAEVVADVTLDEAWTDAGQAPFRAALADQLGGSVGGLVGDETTDEVLALALAQALLAGEGEPGDGPQVLLDLLRQAELVDGTVTSPAESIVIVSGDVGSDDDALAAASGMVARTVGVLTGEATGAVVAGGPEAPGDLASAVRNSPAAAGASTVVDAFTTYGRIAAALALAEQRDGGSGHYGAGEGRDLIPAGTAE